ncbi:nucleotidyltransferase family protein [Lyngbya confervoides]|uniref:NDP-sugar synthase n=1 Tax=Lyngbya confervoides BDU141951 TaxID=1574623 RepID=A0ABD4T8E6_9CYAN|nr:NDP-sugar synthase [Lyngbya confervoides]MCM1985008.1 NDP-sugar synthase [Lyngbya confervoides BDU141951]
MQAVIIAGGKGTRLRPLTYRRPKPMLPLLERPFLDWMVERCRNVGITDILINIHYQADQIRDYFGDGHQFGVNIRYVVETDPLDTAGSMKLAEPYFTGDPLLVFNADILTDLDLAALIKAHQDSQADATLTLARVEDPTAFGLVELQALGAAHIGPVLAFREKPTAQEAAQLAIDTVNAGTYVLNPQIFAQYEMNQPLSFERQVFPDILNQGKKMMGFIWEGYWLDLGTPAKYLQGQLDMLTGAMPYQMPASMGEKSPGIWLADSTVIDAGASVSSPCYLGHRVTLGPNAILPAGTIVHADSYIDAPVQPGIYSTGTLVA